MNYESKLQLMSKSKMGDSILGLNPSESEAE